MQSIERNWNGMPTIIEEKIQDGCRFENTLMSGWGTLVIDNDFINDMNLIANELKDEKNLASLLFKIYTKIYDYFYSTEKNDKSREETYFNNVVTDEDGMIIGTKISSLKGKNISKCSEKSIAAYIILEKIYSIGNMTRKPSLTLSHLKTESIKPEPHAFVMLNRENSTEPTKHLIFDVENPTLIEDSNGKHQYLTGLYSLTDEQYNDFINGLECNPISLYELLGDYHEVGEKRTYGNVKNTKSL